MAIGLLPLWSIPRDAADIVLGGDERVGHTFTEIPLLLAIAFLAGVLETVPWGLMQVYATDNGWSVRAAGFALPVFYWGQIVLTYPIGWIADRIPRRSVLMGTSAAAILCMMALGSWTQSPTLWVIIFASGGIATGTYTIGLAVLGQRFDAQSLVSANAAFIACYGLGTISGPPAVGEFMDRLGPGMLPTSLALVGAAIFFCALGARSEWQTGAPSPSTVEKSG
jgi:predicted MFS family arabinose efflux permease